MEVSGQPRKCTRAMRAFALCVAATVLTAGWFPAEAAPSIGLSADQGRATMTAFFAAYNRHDVNGVLATMAGSVVYLDCDYVRHRDVEFTNKEALSRWLGLRFREHDHVTIDVAEMEWSPNGQVVLTPYSRESDSLTPLVKAGIVSPQDAAKWRLSLSSSLIEFGGLRGPCRAGETPPGAKPKKERALVRRFVAAYNRHDVAAVLRVLSAPTAALPTAGVIYADCDYAGGSVSVLHGKPAVQLWLRSRFAAGDRFTVDKVLTNSDFSWLSDGPTSVKVLATRTIASTPRGGPSQHAVTLRIVPDSSVRHIRIWEAWGSCTVS
jgi:ketosteroid isomerase-like protein